MNGILSRKMTDFNIKSAKMKICNITNLLQPQQVGYSYADKSLIL